MRKGFLLLIVLAILLFLNTHKVSADTFGPICDTTVPGVTCAPTSPPVATRAPTPTRRPTPPVTGSSDITLFLLGLSGLFVIGSVISYTSTKPLFRKQK